MDGEYPVVGSMLVLKTKSDDEGRYVGVKARLTLRGDEMADQAIEKRKRTLTSPKETYSPVTVPPTMKMLHTQHLHDPEVKIALADLHSAYLAATMRKKVAIQLPERWRIGGKDAVHVVIMALYGGDDSGRCFYDLWVDFHKAIIGIQEHRA